MERTSFEFIRGGFNTNKEFGTYCCLKLRSNVIGHSTVSSAFGQETEKSALENALRTLEEIKQELEIKLESYEILT